MSREIIGVAASGRLCMTVCIAAICDRGQKVVVAADRMFTFQAPLNIEFQTLAFR
jgi:hypothetical protein